MPDTKQPYLQKILRGFDQLRKDRNSNEEYLRLLLHVESCADLLGVKPAIPRLGPQEGNTFIEALGSLASEHNNWLRSPETWLPDSHNSRKQFSSLARHLMSNYEVPAFLDTVWFLGDSSEAPVQQSWFRHVGIGQNIRTANIPLKLTKKMAHLVLQAPDDHTVDEALRWGQVLGLGGQAALARAVNGTRLGACFEHEEFWGSVVHFFVNHPMLDPDQSGPIVDYIYNQKFVPREIVGPDGELVQGPPEQPNFAMKGRSINKLLRQVEEWHRLLARDSRLPHKQWAPSGIGEFELEKTDKLSGPKNHWYIRELLTTKELVAEGRSMNHCVGSYTNNCQKGNTSIWSMQVEEPEGGTHRVMTIAVHNGSRSVNQARGKYNALPSGRMPNGRQKALAKIYQSYLRQSKHILFLWREQEGLTMSRGA